MAGKLSLGLLLLACRHGVSPAPQMQGVKGLPHQHVPAHARIAVATATLLPQCLHLLQGGTAPLVLLLPLSLALGGSEGRFGASEGRRLAVMKC